MTILYGCYMLKARGKVWKVTSRNINAHVIYIPADVVKDSKYPFKAKEAVNVELDPLNKRLIITQRQES